MFNNILKVLCSNLIVSLLGFVINFIFPSLMSVEGYAQYQEYLLYVSYLNFCHLGLANGMYIKYAGCDYRKINKADYKSEFFLLLLITAAFQLMGFCFGILLKDSMGWYIVLSIAPLCVVPSFRALYQSWNRFTAFAILNALPNISIVVFGILTYVVTKNISSRTLIVIYMLCHVGMTVYVLQESIRFTAGIKSKKIFTNTNWSILKDGFLIHIGGYINLLIHSVDKQFINWSQDKKVFAVYSFAIATQNIMMLFINALAQPIYLKMVQLPLEEKHYKIWKEWLFMFGSYSGFAFFAVKLLLQNFIPKYTGAINICAIYFAVFPAMGIINVLYVNLYKLTRQMKRYLVILVQILCLAVVLDAASVYLLKSSIGVVIATVVVYYMWLLYSQRDFHFFRISLRDVLYLSGFLSCYFVVTRISNVFTGALLYLVCMTLWNLLCYGDSVRLLLKQLLDTFHGSGD